MARIAVFVDLGFFLWRYRHFKVGQRPAAEEVSDAVWRTARAHLRSDTDELYRILVYDCRPLNKGAHNPVTRKFVDFGRSDLHEFRASLHQALVCKRKVALRLGELADTGRWIIREQPTKALLGGKMTLDQLAANDVEYEVRQKGVDVKMSLDIASIAYKRLADRVVLITGDADFVPAAKLARREGLDVVLDPLWAPISPSLNEHIDGLNTTWEKPHRA
jgi:uncharacterized LabA/DUF88 family protein